MAVNHQSAGTQLWVPSLLARVLGSAAGAGLLSSMALAAAGRREHGNASVPFNAVAHWIWPERAFQAVDTTVRHTGVGTLIHLAAGLVWASLFEYLRVRAGRSRPGSRVGDLEAATAATGIAALVDLRLVPQRLTPGFERKLSNRSLAGVYVAFAAGLWLGAACVAARSPDAK